MGRKGGPPSAAQSPNKKGIAMKRFRVFSLALICVGLLGSTAMAANYVTVAATWASDYNAVHLGYAFYYWGSVADAGCTDYVDHDTDHPNLSMMVVHDCGGAPVVFLGDPITELMQFETPLPDMSTVNLGIGGNTCHDLLNLKSEVGARDSWFLGTWERG